MQSSLPLTFSLTPQRPHLLSHPITSPSILPKPFFNTPSPKSFICYTFSSSSNDKEEARWLCEEQRWLREDTRWLREEQRWKAERDTLLHEIQSLQLKIQELELQGSVSDSKSNMAKLLQVLKDGDLDINISRISDSRSHDVPPVEAIKENEVIDKEVINTIADSRSRDAPPVEAIKENEVIDKEVISFLDAPEKEGIRRKTFQESKSKESKRKTLRKGAEGDDVREMQEALQKLGFYSGEEDMEYSAFDSGTERAVKTWQATLGIPEDGIMTSELLERLYIDEINTYTTANGAPLSSITGTEQSTVKRDDVGVEVSQNRVFLLGENRWEDRSRLSNRKKEPSGSSVSNTSTTKCVTCRGEGRLLCMECDGTGEPNIEEQFMEWADEGSKCPYCEGHGYTTCDVCQGEKVVEA